MNGYSKFQEYIITDIMLVCKCDRETAVATLDYCDDWMDPNWSLMSTRQIRAMFKYAFETIKENK